MKRTGWRETAGLSVCGSQPQTGTARGSARRHYDRLPGAWLTEKRINRASRKARPAFDKSRCGALRDDTRPAHFHPGNRKKVWARQNRCGVSWRSAPSIYSPRQHSPARCLKTRILMVRSIAQRCVSNHGQLGPSFETRASPAPQDEAEIKLSVPRAPPRARLLRLE